MEYETPPRCSPAKGGKPLPSTMRHKYGHRRSVKPSACCCGDMGLKKTDVCETISSVPWDPTVLQESHVGTLTQLETVQFWIAKDMVCSPLPSLQTKKEGKETCPCLVLMESTFQLIWRPFWATVYGNNVTATTPDFCNHPKMVGESRAQLEPGERNAILKSTKFRLSDILFLRGLRKDLALRGLLCNHLKLPLITGENEDELHHFQV